MGNRKKVVIFSVWDPTKGNDPNAVAENRRVEVLDKAEDVLVRRFGGEGPDEAEQIVRRGNLVTVEPRIRPMGSVNRWPRDTPSFELSSLPFRVEGAVEKDVVVGPGDQPFEFLIAEFDTFVPIAKHRDQSTGS